MTKASLINLVMLFNFGLFAQAEVNQGLFFRLGSIFTKKQEQQAAIKPRVAIIRVDDSVDFKKLQLSLISAAKDVYIDGIILSVHSYGGSVSLFGTIHDLIKRIDKQKPVVCFIETAMSAGYIISSACRYVVAHSMSEIGSIGVVWTLDKLKNVKVKNHSLKGDLVPTVFTAGKYKAAVTNQCRELTKEEKDYFNERCFKIYNTVLEQIANNRNISLENSSDWADAKIFVATEALDLKLIDQIGTMLDVEEKIIEFIKESDPETNYDSEIEPMIFDNSSNKN